MEVNLVLTLRLAIACILAFFNTTKKELTDKWWGIIYQTRGIHFTQTFKDSQETLWGYECNKINVSQNLLGENKNRTRTNVPGDAGWEMCSYLKIGLL